MRLKIEVEFWYSETSGLSLSKNFCNQESKLRNDYQISLGNESILPKSEVVVTIYCSSIGALKKVFYFDGDSLLEKKNEEVIWVIDNPTGPEDGNCD